jgi:general stress protein 26
MPNATRTRTARPRADRPNIPYGLAAADQGMGLIPWSRVNDRLRSSYVYWVATAGRDGRPHAVPVWGVWLDGTLYFSNGETTRTGRALASHPAVSVHLESGEDAVIFEGVAEAIRDRATVKRANDAYAAKYLWKERIAWWWAVRPHRAWAWFCPSAGGTESIYASSATRWTFGGARRNAGRKKA